MKYLEIEITKIKADENIRSKILKESIEGLMQSIKEQGILQPILVRVIKDGYDLVAGFRRLTAATALGMKTVPCVIEEVSDEDKAQVQLVENIQREALNPIDEAAALNDLLTKHKLEDLALIVGKTPRWIEDRIKLLGLPMPISETIQSGRISAGHGIVLTRLSDKKSQVALFKEILEERLSISQTEVRLSSYSRKLNAALFDKAECKDCKFSGASIKDMFDDEVSLKGECLNPKCYEKKVQLHIVARVEYWKKEKVPVMSREQYEKEQNKWHWITSYSENVIDKETMAAEIKKGENIAVIFREDGSEEFLVKESVYKVLVKRAKLAAQQKSKKKDSDESSNEDEQKKERDKVRQVNRVDETKRRFLISELFKKVTSKQLDRVILEILFYAENARTNTVGKFLDEKGEKPNYELRHKLRNFDTLSKIDNKKIVAEIYRIAKDNISEHSTEWIEATSAEVDVMVSQFRIDEEYLNKLTKDGLSDLIKEFKLKVPDKFDTKPKSEMVKWILEYKLDKAPKEIK